MTAARIKSGSVSTSAVAVTMDAYYSAVVVTNRTAATNVLSARFGTDPTDAGDNCDVIMPGQSVTIQNPVNSRDLTAVTATDIRVIGSASGTLYTVKGI